LSPRERQLRYAGEVVQRHEADAFITGPGTAVVVKRGEFRSLVLGCPDGCGATLTINLDERTGPAWRLYQGRDGVSVYPSVWRDNGCRSHFIIWHSQIYWCGVKSDPLDEDNPTLEERVRPILGEKFVSYTELADKLQEVPWAVLVACYRLCRRGDAEEGEGRFAGSFRIHA